MFLHEKTGNHHYIISCKGTFNVLPLSNTVSDNYFTTFSRYCNTDIYDSSHDNSDYDQTIFNSDYDQTISPQATHPTAAQMLALYFF